MDISIGRHLDNLLKLRWIPAGLATCIHCSSALPVQLRLCVDALPATTEWRAFTDGAEVYCAIARTGTPISADDWAIALDVYFLDGDAKIWAAGVWEYDWDHSWRLIRILDVVGTEFQPDTAPNPCEFVASTRLVRRSTLRVANPDPLRRAMRSRKSPV
jgi:hypothetical protein